MSGLFIFKRIENHFSFFLLTRKHAILRSLLSKNFYLFFWGETTPISDEISSICPLFHPHYLSSFTLTVRLTFSHGTLSFHQPWPSLLLILSYKSQSSNTVRDVCTLASSPAWKGNSDINRDPPNCT